MPFPVIAGEKGPNKKEPVWQAPPDDVAGPKPQVKYMSSTRPLYRRSKASEAESVSEDLMPCNDKSDCPDDDGLFCNGTIECWPYAPEGTDDATDQRFCVELQPCPVKLLNKQLDPKEIVVCDEELDQCNCHPGGIAKPAWWCNPYGELPSHQVANDMDGDNVNHDEDCDDSNYHSFPGGKEVCDPDGVDEDCEPETFVKRDRDKDGHYDMSCLNVIDSQGHRYAPPESEKIDDCNDDLGHVYRDAPEHCDGEDNNCNNQVDEGQTVTFCLDLDYDGVPGEGGERWEGCPRDGDDGPWVQCPKDGVGSAGYDCDDEDERRRPGNDEICDGIDNDCDDLVDRDEDEAGNPVLIQGQPDLLEHEFVCGCPEEAEACETPFWYPVSCPPKREWCYPDYGADGCKTNITALDQCGDCNPERTCGFACDWRTGCEDIVSVSTGFDFVCGITNLHHVSCWGRGGVGQLGGDMYRGTSVPTWVGLEDVKALSVGAAHACAVAEDDRRPFCWGDNTHWQLGNQDAAQSGAPNSSLPLSVGGGDLNEASLVDVTSVGVGARHSCAVAATSDDPDMHYVWCWGSREAGLLGDTVIDDSRYGPRKVQRQVESILPGFFQGEYIGNAVKVTLGEWHGCLLTEEGQVECWGSNDSGQLGTEDESPRAYAQAVPNLGRVIDVQAGDYHTCALVEGSQVYCWGANSSFQLGREDVEKSSVPVLVESVAEVKALAVGGPNTCVVDTDDHLLCWGNGTVGQLGPDVTDRSSAPIDVYAGPIREAAVGAVTCVLPQDADETFCWGFGRYGQLGRGQVEGYSAQPMAVVPARLREHN